MHLNDKQRVTFSVTQGRQNENEPKMGRKSKSASDYSKENDDLVMETIKGKPELVCKPCCIIILLKKSPLRNLNMLSNTRNKIWTSYSFITYLQQTINKEKSSPSLCLENNNNKIYFCKPYFFFSLKTKTPTHKKTPKTQKTKLRLREIRVGRREITMLLFETQINISSVSGCLATHQC